MSVGELQEPSTLEQPLTPEEATAGMAAVVPAGQSVIEYVRQRQSELAAEERKPLTIVIPEWKGAMAVMFRYPEQGATPIIRAGMQMSGQKPEKALGAALGVIQGAAWQVVGKRPEDDDWKPLDPSGEPVGISQRLAVLLGWEIPAEVRRKGAYVARLLWSPKAPLTGKYEGDLALVSAAGDVTEYLRGVEDEIQEGLEGE